jgi:hypothetical protein
MNSLRDMMETTFAAAAFAERNLPQEARECVEERLRKQSVNANACPKAQAKRQRPSLKA